MKIWLKRIGIVLIVLVLAFVVVGLILPTTYEVSRSVVVHAPRDRVHALVSDLVAWEQWEPWREEDPSIRVTRSAQTSGVGTRQSWTGDSGSGELTFTMSDPDQGIAYDLVFDQTYECTASLTHEPAPDGVKVTWSMAGDTKTPVIGGYFARIMPGMIEPMFDRGLEKLKAAAEGGSDPPPAGRSPR